MRSAYERRTPGLVLLEVSLPGTFTTMTHDGG